MSQGNWGEIPSFFFWGIRRITSNTWAGGRSKIFLENLKKGIDFWEVIW